MNLEEFAEKVGRLYGELEGADGFAMVCVAKNQHLEWHKDADLRLVRKLISAFITLEAAASDHQDDFIGWLENEFSYLLLNLRKNEAQRKKKKGELH